MKKIRFLAAGLGVFALVLAGSASAAEFIAPTNDAEPNVTVSANETHRNLYLAGVNVTVNSVTQGDLVAAGGLVNLVGEVEEDAIVAGGTISLTGPIGGDARLGGGNITISSEIGGDLLLGGGNVSITGNASVGGDLVAGAGNLVVDSPVKGDVRIGGGNITINSKVEGDVWVVADGKDSALIFGPNAEVIGKITYKGLKEAIVQDGAQIGTIDFTRIEGRQGGANALVGLLTLALLIKLAAWIIAGLVLVKLAKRGVRAVAGDVQRKPWSNLGYGLAGVIVMPILAMILFVTLLGFYLGFLVSAVYVLMLALVCLLSAMVLGYWILKYLGKKEEVSDWQAIVIGVVVWQVLQLIPFVGWILMCLVFLMTFGSVMLLLKQKISQEN